MARNISPVGIALNLGQAKRRCRHCHALAEDDKGKWVCDEANLPIEEIKECQEWGK